MRDFRDYPLVDIGRSKDGCLMLRFSPVFGQDKKLSGNCQELFFEKPGAYQAYLVDGSAWLGTGVEKAAEGNWRLTVYDDTGAVLTVRGDIISVWRYGAKGCIIQSRRDESLWEKTDRQVSGLAGNKKN